MQWARVPREGARGASLPRERCGGVAREGTPQFRELVGSEAVVVPGVPLFETRQRGVPAKGATRPTHETVQGHVGKFEGMAQNCEDTNTGDGNLGW